MARMRARGVLAMALSLALAGPVLAEGLPCAPVKSLGLTAVDTDRLSELEASRLRGIKQAREEGDAEARQTLARFFGKGLVAVDALPEGKYRCRTVKLGGPFGPFVAYNFFNCEVSGGELHKLTGSQRFAGELIAVNGGLVFKGADHYDYEPEGKYGADPARNAVGCVSRLADKSAYLLEFPMPFLESLHDVIELVPRK